MEYFEEDSDLELYQSKGIAPSLIRPSHLVHVRAILRLVGYGLHLADFIKKSRSLFYFREMGVLALPTMPHFDSIVENSYSVKYLCAESTRRSL